MRSFFIVLLAAAVIGLVPARTTAQENKNTGELRFSGPTKSIRDSGVWIDDQYVGYINELRGDDDRLKLSPGPHHVIVRQAGYKDFDRIVTVEARKVRWVDVSMEKDPTAVYPSGKASELKLNIAPARAAVFIDDGYIGHASDFGGYRIMVVTPGKHHVKVQLPGYQPFESEVNALPGQRMEVSTSLLKGVSQQEESTRQPGEITKN